MEKNEIFATATINPVFEAVRAALESDNLAGAYIEGTATRVRAVGPLPSPFEDLGWLTRHLTEQVVNDTLKPGEIVFNRYVAWSVWDEFRASAPDQPPLGKDGFQTNRRNSVLVPPTARSGRDPAKDAHDEAKQWPPDQSPVDLVKRIERLSSHTARIALRTLLMNDPAVHGAMVRALEIAESH